jgi:hypothetical protein
VRRFLTLLITFLLLTFFISPTSNAATVVVISEPTHRLSDGVFFDDLLAQKLTPTGELGLLIYPQNSGVRMWQIDPATISEIVAMSNGYGIQDGAVASGQIVATQWLAQFKKVTRFERISSLPYGNPSGYWIDQISKDNTAYLSAISKISLEAILGKATDGVLAFNTTQQSLSKPTLNILKYAQRQIDLLSSLVGQKELSVEQLRLMQLLNPNIEDKRLNTLIKDYDQSITKMRSKLKIKSTKFTVTSEIEELPVTIVNDFNSTVKLKLSTRAINSKVEVAPVEIIDLLPKSKKQVLLPVQVLAPGDSQLLAQLTNLENKPVGYPVYINLKLSVISPVATWITSGAAVLLFIAILVQSVRRVRRRK